MENNAQLPQIELNLTSTKSTITIDQSNTEEKTEKAPRKPLDSTLKTLFTFSILLAGVAIVLFLFAIPCPPPRDHRIWSTSFVNASLSFPVRLSLRHDNQDHIIIMAIDSNQTTTDDAHNQYILALNSSNGHQLWKFNLNDTVTLLACPGQLYASMYGYPFDCLVATSSGELLAFEISSWTIVWRQSITLNNYSTYGRSIAIISDIDHDYADDIMLACNSISFDSISIGRLWIFLSSSTGKVIRQSAVVADEQFVPNSLIVDTNFNKEVAIYFTINFRNMSSRVLSIRGRELSSIISSIDNDDANSKVVLDGGKIELPSILVDLNDDGYNDVLTTFSNGTIIATLGSTMARYWAFHLRESNIMK